MDDSHRDSNLPEGMYFMTDEQLDRYQRQIAESDGFDVDEFPGAVNFIIRPLPPEFCTPDEYDVGPLVDKAVEFYNVAGNNTERICNPRIVKVNIDSATRAIYYITFEADSFEAACNVVPNVYQAEVFCVLYGDPVAKFCRCKGSVSNNTTSQESSNDSESSPVVSEQ